MKIKRLVLLALLVSSPVLADDSSNGSSEENTHFEEQAVIESTIFADTVESVDAYGIFGDGVISAEVHTSDDKDLVSTFGLKSRLYDSQRDDNADYYLGSTIDRIQVLPFSIKLRMEIDDDHNFGLEEVRVAAARFFNSDVGLTLTALNFVHQKINLDNQLEEKNLNHLDIADITWNIAVGLDSSRTVEIIFKVNAHGGLTSGRDENQALYVSAQGGANGSIGVRILDRVNVSFFGSSYKYDTPNRAKREKKDYSELSYGGEVKIAIIPQRLYLNGTISRNQYIYNGEKATETQGSAELEFRFGRKE